MRISGMGCRGSVIVSFPKARGYKGENILCNQILYSDLISDGVDPALRRTNFAVIKLKNKTSRRPIKISKAGLSNQRSYHVWSSTKLSPTVSTQVKKKCRPVYNSYANPFAVKDTSPSVVMNGCEFEPGNSGSIILNNKKNLVGVLNSPIWKVLVDSLAESGLYKEPLDHLTYASNAFCLDYEGGKTKSAKECGKVINITKLDRIHSKMLNSRENHIDIMKKFEKENEPSNRYFKWDIIFSSSGKRVGAFHAEMTKPKCFFGIKDWIWEFRRRGKKPREYGFVKYKIPKFSIYTTLDDNLNVTAETITDGFQEYKFSFNPRSAYYSENTDVKVQEYPSLGTQSVKFKDLNDDCSATSSTF
jgi:hypothetical protein